MAEIPAEWTRIVRIAASAWHANDRDDLMQEALIALWLEQPQTWGAAMKCAQRRMIDAMRAWYGRHRWTTDEHGNRVAVTVVDRWSVNPHPRGFAPSVRTWDSLDVPLDPDEPTTYADVIPGGVDPEAEALADEHAEEMRARVLDVIAQAERLAAFERDAVLCPVTGEYLREVGARYGVTESRACQVRKRARRRLAAA